MPSKQILIVEDETLARESLKLLIELEGFEARAAANGREALDIISESGLPCLIVLDMMMPLMNGWELLEALETRDLLRDARIVVVSAAPDIVRSPLTRRYPILPKPFDIESILDIARECCEGGG